MRGKGRRKKEEEKWWKGFEHVRIEGGKNEERNGGRGLNVGGLRRKRKEKK